MKKLFNKNSLFFRLSRQFSSPASIIQEQISLMRQRGYLYDQSIDDNKMRAYFISALVNPNILKDGYLVTAGFYKTFKDYFTQSQNSSSQTEIDFDIEEAREVFMNSLSVLRNEEANINIKDLSIVCSALDFFISNCARDDVKAWMIKVQNGFLTDQNFFKREFNKKSAFYKLYDVIGLIKIAYKYEQTNTVTILLRFIDSKSNFINLRLANIIIDALSSFWLDRFYAIEMHRVKEFLENTLLPKLHELLSNIDFKRLKYDRDMNPQRLMTYISLMSKFRVENKKLLDLCCKELNEMIKKIDEINDRMFHLLKYFKIIKNFNEAYLNAFSAFRESILALEVNELKPMNIVFLVQHLMQIELANANQRLEFTEFIDEPLFVVCSHKIEEIFEDIVPVEFYKKLLDGLKDLDPNLISEQSIPFRERLSFFLRKFKKINTDSYFDTDSIKESKNKHRDDEESFRPSNSLVCHVRLLLDKIPDLSYTEEVLLCSHKTDFFIKTKNKGQIVLELDGPVHFTSAEQYSNKSIMRNLFLIREGYQVVTIRNNLLECAITNGTADKLLRSILKSNDKGWTLASMVSV